jgi:hypothetical protein
MRLQEVFARCDALSPLLRDACALDDEREFFARVAALPLDAALLRNVREAAARFAERAGIEAGEVRGLCFGGQQPYVDYYPAVLAKLDALEEANGFYAFADYAPLGSDPWMARTTLPCATSAEGVLHLSFIDSQRAHRGKDLRFVPPPSAAALHEVEERLKSLIAHAPLPRRAARARLTALMSDYDEARRRARHFGDFTSIASARLFRRLGFRLPLLSLSELLELEAARVAELVELFARERERIDDAVDEALALGGDELHFTRKPRGSTPLAVADADGVRRPAASIEPGRWSLDVFAPIFLMRLGITGLVSGRGSIRYSLVLGRVMQRLFGMPHVPNLLCSAAPPPSGPFHDAAPRLRAWEPTLIARLLADEPAVIREEIRASWRNAGVPA